MSTSNISRAAEVDAEIRHIGDLVVVRNLLAARGATASELREYNAVIDGARRRLAESAKRTPAGYASAASSPQPGCSTSAALTRLRPSAFAR
jgi:hypothetical protein